MGAGDGATWTFTFGPGKRRELSDVNKEKHGAKRESDLPRPRPAGEARHIPGKASPSARWRRIRTLAEQGLELASAGDLERTKSTLEAILAIASQAVREFEELGG